MSTEFHEREDRLGVDRHLRLGARDAIASEKRIVVQHDPVVDADDCAMTNGVVVRRDIRVTLREVAYVDQGLPGLRPDSGSSTSALAPPRSFVPRACCSPRRDGRIRRRRALGDPREECLGSECPVDGRLRIEAESGYSAHELENRVASGSSLTRLILSPWIGRHEDRRRA